jgi:hypothetical protein
MQIHTRRCADIYSSTDLSQALLVCGLTSSPMDLLKQCSQKRLVQSLLQHANMPLALTCVMHSQHKKNTSRCDPHFGVGPGFACSH